MKTLLVKSSLGDIDLKEVLKELVEENTLFNRLHVHVLVDEKYNEKEIDKMKELMLYRIVQEQLNNILKYARAKKRILLSKHIMEICFYLWPINE